jgi:hypothetical protein
LKVLYAFVCEDGEERSDGRVDAHGIFSQLWAPSFPAMQQHMTVVVVVEWEPDEQGQSLPFAIEMMDPGNSPVLSITGHTEVGVQQPFQGPPKSQFIIPLDDVPFPAAGVYHFEVVVREERERVTSLHLIQVPGDN